MWAREDSPALAGREQGGEKPAAEGGLTVVDGWGHAVEEMWAWKGVVGAAADDGIRCPKARIRTRRSPYAKLRSPGP